tara:strand:+ start:28 stop:357 length:330 start_codon:yes stop_codon:yes gene_type:complete
VELMDQIFKRKWIKIINQSDEKKCRLFIKRLKQQPIDVPFNSKQKFVWKLLRTRLEYLAQEKNLNKEIIRLPTAEPTDLNWSKPKTILNRAYQEYLIKKEIWTKPKNQR